MKFYEDYAPVENIFDGIGRRSKGGGVKKEDINEIQFNGVTYPLVKGQVTQADSNIVAGNFEQGKRAALEAVAEIFERIEKANVFLEKAREEKNLVEFVYWFVLIHENYYMLQKPLFPEELERIYAEMECYTPIDYLKHKRKQCYERLPDFHTTYGRGYNIPDIIGCALSNRYEEEIFTFYPNIKKMFCGGTLERQNLMLHFLQRGENREQIDYCDVCGKNLNDQPYPYTYRCTTCGRTFNLCAKCSEGHIHKYWGEVGRKAHDDYEELVHSRMFQQEQMSHRQYEIDQMFADKGMLEFTEGGKVNAREIVSVLNTVVGRIKGADESFYRRYLQKSVILYTYNDQNIKTVCVDERNNVYVSANYLYNVLKMDEELIYALFMNVAYRIKNDYFTEERRFLSKGMQRDPFRELGGGLFTAVELTKPLHHDMNIALDLQANVDLVNSEILPYDSIINKMNAICTKNRKQLFINHYYYNEKMGEIQDEINLKFPIEPSCKPIPDTFLAGYRHTRIRIGRLVTNYGEVRTYEKLKPIIKKL